MKKFTLDIKYDSHKMVDKGAIDASGFIKVFDVETKSSSDDLPTFYVRNHVKKEILWTSIVGEGDDIEYLIEYIFRKEPGKLYGEGNFGEVYTIQGASIRNASAIKGCFLKFFEEQGNEVSGRLRTFEDFSEEEDLEKWKE